MYTHRGWNVHWNHIRKDLWKIGTTMATNNYFTVQRSVCKHCSKADNERCERWHTGFVVKLLVSFQSTHSTFSFLSMVFSFTLSLRSLIRHECTLHPSTHKSCLYSVLTCKCLQTDKHTHWRSRQAVCRESATVQGVSPLTVGKQCSSLVQNSGARHSPIEQTECSPASNSRSVPTLH